MLLEVRPRIASNTAPRSLHIALGPIRRIRVLAFQIGGYGSPWEGPNPDTVTRPFHRKYSAARVVQRFSVRC